jgi:hypothetical protein
VLVNRSETRSSAVWEKATPLFDRLYCRYVLQQRRLLHGCRKVPGLRQRFAAKDKPRRKAKKVLFKGVRYWGRPVRAQAVLLRRLRRSGHSKRQRPHRSQVLGVPSTPKKREGA